MNEGIRVKITADVTGFINALRHLQGLEPIASEPEIRVQMSYTWAEIYEALNRRGD